MLADVTKWIRAGRAGVATLSFGFATWMTLGCAALVRSNTFGFDPVAVLQGLMLTGMLAGPIYLLFVIALPRPVRVGWRLALASVIAIHTMVELRMGHEDAEFRAAVGDCVRASRHHTRAAPFESSGIGCNDGEFSAHD